MTQQNTNIQSSINEDESIDLGKILHKCLQNWYWFAFTILAALVVAFAYLRYTTPIYQVRTSILMENEKSSPYGTALGANSQANIFQGLGMMGSMRNIHNQMVIVTSSPIVTRTLSELNFNVTYYSLGRVSVKEQYKTAPFVVVWDDNRPQIIDADFKLNIESNGDLHLSIEAENAMVYDITNGKTIKHIPRISYSKKFRAGSKVLTDAFSFTINLTEHFNPEAPNNYSFRFHSNEMLVKQYCAGIEVALANKETSILHISHKTQNPQKGIDFLNKLSEVYQSDNLDKKNENANRTIQFISSQLASISDSLTFSQSQMETFQSENKLLDISLQSQQVLEQMRDLDKERLALETQNKYYYYLKKYIQKEENDIETIIAPSAMGIQDPLLNNLILQLNQLATEKSSQTSIRQNSQHPTIIRINSQIESVRSSLRENVNNIISQSDIALSNLNTRIRQLEAQVRRLPATERNYINIERKYTLNNETYTFLLQKLSEAQIAMASNTSDGQVIEEAHMVGNGPISPKGKVIYAIALILGLGIPLGFIVLLDLLNNKINSQQDIEQITQIPIIGHVLQNTDKKISRQLMLERPQSPASETFRAIRSNLNLIVKNKEKPVIAITSAFMGEGKSYNTINIAASMAMLNKKVAILDLDLRNSKLAEEFMLDSGLGVVDYIIDMATFDEIVYDTRIPELKLIPAGSIPPNPAEMLVDPKMTDLLQQLKQRFDVIIIDTPPVGLVADIFPLYEQIDSTIIVVRYGYTRKAPFKDALCQIEKNQLKGLAIVMNGIKNSHYRYGYNGYGYGYGYGYGHETTSNRRNKRQKPKPCERKVLNFTPENSKVG